jgi:hypothetical protein
MTLSRNNLWISLPALMLAAATVLAGPPQAVSECDTYITEPGKYSLVNDLYCDPGVRPVKILASDVMFDLGGHSINCAVGDRSGVVVGDDMDPEVFTNVRIRNGAVNGCAVGVLLWFTDGAQVTKMSFSGSTESGVTLVEAQNNVIMNNQFEGDFWAINSYAGTGNRYSHNTVHFSVIGIDLYGETDSRITCNTVGQGFYTLSLGPSGPLPSSGNLVRGNLVTDSFLGIAMVGYGTPDGGLIAPQSIDNLIHANIATGNWWDMAEVLYNPFTDELFVEPGAVCANTWKNNQFDWPLGPPDCIGTPIDLDEVCALEGDDD